MQTRFFCKKHFTNLCVPSTVHLLLHLPLAVLFFLPQCIFSGKHIECTVEATLIQFVSKRLSKARFFFYIFYAFSHAQAELFPKWTIRVVPSTVLSFASQCFVLPAFDSASFFFVLLLLFLASTMHFLLPRFGNALLPIREPFCHLKCTAKGRALTLPHVAAFSISSSPSYISLLLPPRSFSKLPSGFVSRCRKVHALRARSLGSYLKRSKLLPIGIDSLWHRKPSALTAFDPIPLPFPLLDAFQPSIPHSSAHSRLRRNFN